MSATVKSFFVILSLSAMCNASSSQISYAGPAGWEIFRELSEVEDDAKAELCLYSDRYWKETSGRTERSDWRVLNKHPEAIRTVLEQRLKEQAVKKILEKPLIIPLEEELLSHAVSKFVSHELARVVQHKRPNRLQRKAETTNARRYAPRVLARASDTSNVAVSLALVRKTTVLGRKNTVLTK